MGLNAAPIDFGAGVAALGAGATAGGATAGFKGAGAAGRAAMGAEETGAVGAAFGGGCTVTGRAWGVSGGAVKFCVAGASSPCSD